MLRFITSLLAIFLALPIPALAADLTFSLGGDAEYDSNVFRRENDVEDDFLFRIRPGVKVHEDRGQDVNFSAGYEFPVEFAVKNSNRLNDYDHLANGDITYHVNDRLDLFASEDFRYLRSILRQEFDSSGSLVGGIPLIDTTRDRVTLNTAALGATYRFTPRLSGTARAEHRYFDTTRDDRQKNWAVYATGDLHYVLTSQHTVGFGVRYIRQDFEESDTLVASVSDTYNGYASWRYQITESTAFEAAAGPSFIQIDPDAAPSISVTPIPKFVNVSDPAEQYVYLLSSCPFLPGSTTQQYIPVTGCGMLDGPLTPVEIAAVDGANSAGPVAIANDNAGSDKSDDLTVFANLTLSHRWAPNLASALRYDRSQGTASGLGGTVTLDAVSLSTTWDFAERWQLAVRGDWTHRKSVTDATQVFYIAELTGPVGAPQAAQFSNTATTLALDTNRIETNRWGVAGRLTHQVWRHTNVFLQLAYNEQTSKANSLGAFSDFEDWLVTFGVRHVFEPIKLW